MSAIHKTSADPRSETAAKPQKIVTFNAVTLLPPTRRDTACSTSTAEESWPGSGKYLCLPRIIAGRAASLQQPSVSWLRSWGRTTVSEPPRLTGPAARPLPRRTDTPTAAEQLLRLVVLPRIQRDKWSLYWKARTHELSPAAFAHSIRNPVR
jgi:hypothetical protein